MGYVYEGMVKKPKLGQKGRPPLEGRSMQQIAIRLPLGMLAAIDEMMVGRLDQPERSTIIRELLHEAIMARSKKRSG